MRKFKKIKIMALIIHAAPGTTGKISATPTFCHSVFGKIYEITKVVYKIAKKILTSVANFFHRCIFSKQTPAIKNPAKESALANPEKKAQAIFVFRSPGSGKNSYVDKFCSSDEYKSYTIIDADLEMEKIPGYQEALKKKDKTAADRFHGEALDKRNALFEKTKKDKGNFIYVGSGAHLAFYKNILASVKTAYHVKTVFIEISLKNALERAEIRAKQTGRFVPEGVIRDNFDKASKNFPLLKKIADCFEVYDSNTHMHLKESTA